MQKRFFRMRDLCRPDGRYPWSKAHIYNLIAQGRFPAGIKFGGSVIWSDEQLEKWESEHMGTQEGA